MARTLKVFLTRMHSSRMRTARSSNCLGGLHQASPGTGTPREQAPQGQADTSRAGAGTPPPEAGAGIPRDQTLQTRHPPCGQMHACKHITLPQTSFAGGKNEFPVTRNKYNNFICVEEEATTTISE